MGNDVVDLGEPENRGKSRDDRFLSRVFTAEERELIAMAASPDALLWSLWAAKEAAYKAASGNDPSVCSIPHRYRVVIDGGDPSAPLDLSGGSAAILGGRVITPCGEVALRITVTSDYVHAIAARSDAMVAGIIQRVDLLDGGGNPGDPSAFVRRRLLAEVSRRLDCPLDDLAVRQEPPGSRVPRVFLRERPLEAEVSLSHDGRFAAFALALQGIK